jgi:RNAse (barnase) inhibitor barstar
MAIFRDDDFDRLDWRLLQNGAISLYYRVRTLREDVTWLANNGYVMHELDCSAWNSQSDFHDAVKVTLKFPDYYGRNLAAFNDCLSDLDVPDEGGSVLIFRRFDRFVEFDAEFAGWVLDSIQDNSRRLSLWGRRLLALLQSDDPRLSLKPVGACRASWNPREWLNSSRGL